MLNNTASKKKRVFSRIKPLLTVCSFCKWYLQPFWEQQVHMEPVLPQRLTFPFCSHILLLLANWLYFFSCSLLVNCCGSGMFGGKKHYIGTFPFWVSKHTKGLCNLLCSVSPFWNILLLNLIQHCGGCLAFMLSRMLAYTPSL